jgi:uroporphyrinogen-III synthase
MSATASDAIASAHQFLHDWNLRVEPIGFTPTTSMSSPRTLFVGTDPTRFLRFGPITHCPLIQQTAKPVAERVRQIQQAQAEGIDGILFPSRFAVDATLEALTANGQALADLANLGILAVGPATAARLQEHGLTPTRSVADYGGIEALASLSDDTLAGTYLYTCSDLAPQAQRIARMAHCGIKLVPAVVYETQRITGAQLPDTPFDRVLFTSPSTVAAYFDTFPSEQQQPRIWLAIGPATANALRERGVDAIRLSVI